jgi:diguanylate cyclase (GGDEF)-like protein
MILPETNIDGAMVAAERVRNSIASLSIPVAPETTVNLTASIGIATFPDHGDSEQTLLSAADAALYEAKRAGRNRVCVSKLIKIHQDHIR